MPRKTIAFILALTILSGCSVFVPHRQQFTVTASEKDAEIYINGERAGSGCAQKMVPRNKTVSVLVKKTGYFPTQREVGKELASVGIVDIIGGCVFLVPFVGLMTPGAYTLEQDNISVIMEPLPEKIHQ